MKKLFFLLFPVVILILAFKTDRDHTIKGFVRDVNGNALAGVSIRYVGASIVTTSGKDGSYSISVPSLKGELAFTSVGFSELIIPIKGLTKLDVVLHELQQDLQEVVVVGYGAEKEKGVYRQCPGSGICNEQIAPGARTRSAGFKWVL
ncbi:MAG: carboxypeptidase-like regulatory domain-containing protein [Chitinophagaceae bacterium]|nr:carboxypeptidase-like regulatory domain-containing protein [Chitinophagaceae bacterium]